MHCLKCGIEIKAPAVFCKDCQLEIQNDPVQQDAPIILPVHPKQQADPKPYRHSRPQARLEELVARQKQKIKHLRILVCILLASTLLLTALAVLQNFSRMPEFEIGKNYNTIAPETVEPSTIPALLPPTT